MDSNFLVAKEIFYILKTNILKNGSFVKGSSKAVTQVELGYCFTAITIVIINS